LKAAAERREIERKAAIERMEEKERKWEERNGLKTTEKFVTDSYKKQMEINNKQKMMEEIEEKVNAKKTANAERGMTGFYANLLTKNSALGNRDDGEEDVFGKV